MKPRLDLELTRGWHSTNEAGGDFAEAIRAVRDGETPETIGNALVHLESAHRNSLRAAGQAKQIMDDISKLLRTR